MSQLATIFEKIKEAFFENQTNEEKKEAYKLVFAPFSISFTNEDFLFLTDENLGEKRYLDELFEFAQISNTIPDSDNYWVVSGNYNDHLNNRYTKIIEYLKYIDTDSLKADMFYGHPVFNEILSRIDESIKKGYEEYYKQYLKIKAKIKSFKGSENTFDVNMSSFNIDVFDESDSDDYFKDKEDYEKELESIIKKWETEGNRRATEKTIIKNIVEEAERFFKDHANSKGKLNGTKRMHIGSMAEFNITSCSPNNLYESDKLPWIEINIDKAELERIKNSEKTNEYKTILGESDLLNIDIESIGFEVVFVNVVRSWFEEWLLTSRFWDIGIFNEKEIAIPCYTAKLIFVRRIDVQINEAAQHNKEILSGLDSQNLGPFIVNTTQLKSSGKLKVQAVNQALNIDRQLVHKVSASIQEKEKTIEANDETIQKLISKKQNQFPKVSERLKSMVENKITEPPMEQAPSVFNNNIQSTTAINNDTNLIKYEFNFVDNNEESTDVLIDEINIFKDYQEQNVKTEKTESGSILILLQKNDVFKLIVEKKGFKKEEIIIDSHGLEGSINTTQMLTKIEPVEIKIETEDMVENTIATAKKVEVKTPKEPKTDNNFQLIGVIAKKVGSFPKPFEKAAYH